MKKWWMAACAAGMLCGTTQAAETSFSGYGSYWKGDQDEAVGIGGKLRKTFLGFGAADVRVSMLDFKDSDLTMYPVEATLMARIPFLIEPYAGVGAGYYFMDSELPNMDSGAGYYGVAGLQLNLVIVGALVEVRYNDCENDLFDGVSANVGLLVKW